jgi:hypothetical protein
MLNFDALSFGILLRHLTCPDIEWWRKVKSFNGDTRTGLWIFRNSVPDWVSLQGWRPREDHWKSSVSVIKLWNWVFNFFGTAEANNGEPKSCFGWVMNFKLGLFIVIGDRMWFTITPASRVGSLAQVLSC